MFFIITQYEIRVNYICQEKKKFAGSIGVNYYTHIIHVIIALLVHRTDVYSGSSHYCQKQHEQDSIQTMQTLARLKHQNVVESRISCQNYFS